MRGGHFSSSGHYAHYGSGHSGFTTEDLMFWGCILLLALAFWLAYYLYDKYSDKGGF